MTFDELDETLRTRLEQLAFDAGCAWIEEFREERGRDPEPEECDEEAAATAEKLSPQVLRLMEERGVSVEAPLVQSVRRTLREQFVEALDV